MKKLFKKTITVFLCVVIALSCLSAVACGDKNKKQYTEDGKLLIQLYGRDNDSEKTNYEAFINAYNNSQDAVYVDLEWESSATTYNQTLNSFGNDLPHVFMLSNEMFMSYAKSGKLYNFKADVSQTELDALYYDSYSVYCFNDETSEIGYSQDASLYGLPKDQGPYALVVNYTLLKSAIDAYNATANTQNAIDFNAITNPKDPMTFTEFKAVGNKIKGYLGAEKYFCSGYDLQSAVYSNNSNFFTDNTAKTANITDPNFVGAVQFIQDLYKDGLMLEYANSNKGESTFVNGNSCFYYIGPWEIKDYWQSDIQFEWNILPVLCGDAEGAVSTSYTGGMCYAICKNKANVDEEVKNACVDLVKYLSTNLNAQINQMSRGQCIPNIKSLADVYSSNDCQYFITTTGSTNPSPTNRGVFIDAVNGTSATDKVTCKYRAESYTFISSWYTGLSAWIKGDGSSYGCFYTKNGDSWVNVAEALQAYKPTMQQFLDEAYAYRYI